MTTVFGDGSPEAATTELASMTAAYQGSAPVEPKTALEAQGRLNDLSRDSAFAARLTTGDVAARKEFDALCALVAGGNAVDFAMAGVIPPQEITTEDRPSVRTMISAAETWRESGLSDDVVEQILNDRPVTLAERRLVEQFQRQRHGDPAWVRRLLAGDYDAKRELTLMSVVMASEVAA